eukprot:1157306-Pelagomonas_calceolata.AAC.6
MVRQTELRTRLNPSLARKVEERDKRWLMPLQPGCLLPPHSRPFFSISCLWACPEFCLERGSCSREQAAVQNEAGAEAGEGRMVSEPMDDMVPEDEVTRDAEVEGEDE